jgi:hypothetical protein
LIATGQGPVLARLSWLAHEGWVKYEVSGGARAMAL